MMPHSPAYLTPDGIGAWTRAEAAESLTRRVQRRMAWCMDRGKQFQMFRECQHRVLDQN